MSTPEPPVTGPAATQAPREKDSGRIAFDGRGNAVWEWKAGDGQFERDASTTLMKKLEAPELSLEATAIVKQMVEEASVKARLPCDGFDPYDSGVVGTTASSAASPPAPHRAASGGATVSPPRTAPDLLQRLQSWVGGKGSARR